jgi:hypothetical protein
MRSPGNRLRFGHSVPSDAEYAKKEPEELCKHVASIVAHTRLAPPLTFTNQALHGDKCMAVLWT